jgi:hypothetical protein
MPTTVTLHEISFTTTCPPVAHAVLAHGREEPLPLCVLPSGACGTRDSFSIHNRADRSCHSVPEFDYRHARPWPRLFMEDPARYAGTPFWPMTLFLASAPFATSANAR